jgi:hypothetical protein
MGFRSIKIPFHTGFIAELNQFFNRQLLISKIRTIWIQVERKLQLILKGSGDGVEHPEALGFGTSSVVRNFQNITSGN